MKESNQILNNFQAYAVLIRWNMENLGARSLHMFNARCSRGRERLVYHIHMANKRRVL
jgi:hypothetical protein